MLSTSLNDQDFFKNMPKVELHAHLNGCLRRKTLKKIIESKNIQADYSCFETNDLVSAFKIFDLIYRAIEDLTDIKLITSEILYDFQKDNVQYLELRTSPKQSQKHKFTYQQYIDTVINEIKKQEYNCQDMVTRLILSIDRSKTQQESQEIYQAIQQYMSNSFVVGIDFCGNPYNNSFNDFLSVFQCAKKDGFKTTLHAAEIKDSKKEVLSMLDFQPTRLGHFNYFDKELFQMVLESKIPIEMCPSSNMFTLQLQNMNQHHFNQFFMNQHPISLNTDDTCIFNSPNSKEYQLISKAFNLTKPDIKTILLDSVNMAFDQGQSSQLKKKIDHYFGDSQQ